MGKLISFLFNLARKLTDVKAVASGDPNSKSDTTAEYGCVTIATK